MMKEFSEHLSAERLQALLEGDLPGRERRSAEEHVAECARCSAELDSWRVLFEDLSGLPAHGPGTEFADRVMANVRLPERRAPLAARVRARLASVLAAARPEHVDAERLQDFVDGVLPARQTARIEAHVGECVACASELHAWRSLAGRLSELGHHAPAERFAERVMASVDLRTEAPAPVQAAARENAWRRALVWGRRLVPRTRRAWAALAGVAVTPAVTVGLVFYVVFSHPTLTPGALASFIMWKAGELLSYGWSVVAGAALAGVQSSGLGGLVETAMNDPLMIAGAALAYSVVSVLALRVLYKNLIGSRRHARLSHS
jgi:anti-sigma factor RsiW